MGWGSGGSGTSFWGGGPGGNATELTPFDMLLASQQGRIAPVTVSAFEGVYVFVLGSENTVPEHLPDIEVGDFAEISQTADFDTTEFVELNVAVRGPSAITEIAATQILTLTGLPLDTETIIIGSKTYTFETVLSSGDGNVLIGATERESIENLVAAINLTDGSGTIYSASTTANTDVRAFVGASAVDTLDVEALVAGTAGNSIGTTETLSAGSWGGATLSGGATTSWKLSLRIDGAERFSRTFVASTDVDMTMGANVSALAGDHTLAIRLELV